MLQLELSISIIRIIDIGNYLSIIWFIDIDN